MKKDTKNMVWKNRKKTLVCITQKQAACSHTLHTISLQEEAITMTSNDAILPVISCSEQIWMYIFCAAESWACRKQCILKAI